MLGVGVGDGDGNACSGRCGFRRVTTLGYGVSRWPSVEGAPRGLIGAPRIDPITSRYWIHEPRRERELTPVVSLGE